MSTVSKPPAPKSRPAPPQPDPYRYGWRYVRTTRPDGTEVFDQVPLTLEDVLHPEEGDFIVQTSAHNSDRDYLYDVSEARLEDDQTAVVLADCRVEWNIPGVRPLGPDIAVFVNVKRRIDWDTFDVKAEGARPVLVVEVTSRSPRKNDLGIKVDYYHRAKVPLYLIADAVGRGAQRRVKLIGRRYARNGYKLITPGEQGRIYLEPLRLWVGVVRDHGKGYERLACYDPDTGDELGNYAATRRQLVEARVVAETEVQARAAAERGRTEAEARAQAEARARSEAEERLRALQAELKKSRRRRS